MIIPTMLHSGIIYTFPCGGCGLTFYSKCHFKDRKCKHFEILTLSGNRVKDDDDSVIKKYFLFYNHSTDCKDVSLPILTRPTLKLT